MKEAFSMQRCLAAALAAVLLLSGASCPDPAAAATAAPSASGKASAPKKSLTSILLVAQDAVSDPNFGGSIVVVMNDLGPGPVGLILNRPTPLTVAKLFPKLKRLEQVRDKVYFGGPVEFDTVWFLFRAGSAPKSRNAVRVCDGVYVSDDDGLLRELLRRPHPMDGLRIFIGHAGWAPGQLQAEIQGGAWLLRRADAGSIFNPGPRHPWPSEQAPKGGT